MRRLGAELRRLRDEAGYTQAGLAEKIGRTHVSIVNWEHGKTRIGKADLHMVLGELKAPASVKRVLEKLRMDGRVKGWWGIYNLPEWLRPLVSFESDATSVVNFEPVVVPGLLQTEEYSRTLHVTAGLPHTVPPDEAESRIELRRERQKRLHGRSPMEFHAVIAEAALRLEVGGPTTMAEQLWHLVRLASAPNIRIQVLPYRAGAHAGVGNNFAVLNFSDAKLDPPLGYVDGPLGGHFVPDQQHVEALQEMFDQVSALALAETESVDFLAGVRAEYCSREAQKTPRKGKGGP